MKKFSRSWKSSKNRRKQRKYRLNAPLHLRKKFLSAHLNKDLRKKYNTRSLSLRKGDEVKVMRGDFKGEEGKVNRIDTKNKKIYVEGIEISKKDGTKAFRPFKPSNLMITKLNTDDKKRLKNIIEEKK